MIRVCRGIGACGGGFLCGLLRVWVGLAVTGRLPLGGAWCGHAVVFGLWYCESGSGALLGAQDNSVFSWWRVFGLAYREGVGGVREIIAWLSDPCLIRLR